ncbi:MAG TPA: chemotaxis protein CheB [Spirochaetota bacterium]|nr:chemotaxis protein CheB [Spirochaetota bacterium]
MITTENQVTTGIARLLRSLHDASLRLASCHPDEIGDYDFGALSLVLLDNEMPDGASQAVLTEITTLPAHPPILLLSDPTVESMRIMLDALEAGADDFLPRPSENLQMDPDVLSSCISEKVFSFTRQPVFPDRSAITKLEGKKIKTVPGTISIIALGLGTGGTKAIMSIVPQLPKRPRIACLAVLQAPPPFLPPLSAVLAERSPVEVHLARHHLDILPGRLILASSAMQMGVIKCEDRYLVEHTFADSVSGQLPSIDYLFRTIADAYGKDALCVLMTGSGSDGVSGLRLLKSRGALVLGQHPETNAAPERVLQAIELGMFSELIPLPRLAKRIREIVNISEAKKKVAKPVKQPQ